jgi:hypothetical protein
MHTSRLIAPGSFIAALTLLAGPALAQQGGGGCSSLPSQGALKTALQTVVAAGGNGGLGFNMWGTIVDNSGIVCAVAYSGASYTSQWLGSRVISAQKANTANAFSLGAGSTPSSSLFGTKGLALSTANLFSAVQPGGSLYGLQHSNPVDTGVAYGNAAGGEGNPPANAGTFGTTQDPLVGQRVGGVNVFGGGLALYQKNGVKVGGLGVSGDQSCTDHMVAWWTRYYLHLDHLAAVPGVSGDATRPDNIVFDIQPNPDGTGSAGPFPYTSGEVGHSAGGFGHPQCLNNPNPASLPVVEP